ncbi:MAG: mucoidy inhibitor MuiA family protein [Paludibacteraceae bacterium]|nr:mucoidy inhibitor MuiA family protein [Paludibacteraceae bacterium]
MNRRIIMSMAVCLSMAMQAGAVDVSSKAKEVTVFTSGAQVTRTATAQVAAGQSEVRIMGLSPYIDSKSVQVKAKGSGLTIMSVSQQKNYVEKSQTDKEVEALKKQKDDISTKISIEKTNNEVADAELSFIQANQTITGADQSLSIATLKQTNDYYRERIKTLKLQKIDTDKKIAELEKQKAAIEKQINELNGRKNDEATGMIVVKLNAAAATNCSFEISYVVRNASWTPAYDIRVNNVDEPVQLVYKADIRQNTKEKWDNVKLTLSTANPNVSGEAPVLSSYILKERPQMVAFGAAKRSYKPMMMAKSVANETMMDAAMPMELEEEAAAPQVVQSDNMTTKEFKIKMPYTLNSSNQSSQVEIENYKLKATFEYYCAPKLDKDAFLMANVTDWVKLNLMSGDASLFFENTFVGKTRIESTRQNDTLKLSLGRDKSILVTREAVKDYTSTKTLSSKREVERGWKISAKNNKKTAIKLAVHDQMPVSGQSDIEVTSLGTDGASKNETTGELVWKMDLNAGEKKDVTFRYKVKYPKDKNIVVE